MHASIPCAGYGSATDAITPGLQSQIPPLAPKRSDGRHWRVPPRTRVVGESALHATLRLLFVDAEVDRHQCWRGELPEGHFFRLTRAAGKLAASQIILVQGSLPGEGS